ncbi:DNA-binding PadR family transcriptional regulator [Kitasatospora sp. MAP12-15]|uniref:PadR family transcriptional regulator n=1 Tax=unclassified Kitasatospora TaxID=2633591 RepID=UPI0024768032|nr:PadR family transcriptional regulator [Kitasatospora sp. MAP12-44]MDH6112763.1 DNA-binding PadR family transcriptional regulator [Kitasatospora sp. MAP12-44]
MSAVFAHGRLRLYLLKLLDESPRHGYEVIRLLEERFHGLYAPSAGTVYPRLAKLEQEGLVEHSTEGGRKVYRITEAGRTELTARQDDLAELEVEIRDSVAQLAGAIREDVRDSAKDLRDELRNAAKNAARATEQSAPSADAPPGAPWGDKSWQRTREEFAEFKAQAKRAKEQERAAKEQTKRAKEEARKAREQSQAVRQAAQQEALRIKRRVEQQVREHAAKGDWPAGLAEGFSELTRGLAGLADSARWGTSGAATDAPKVTVTRVDLEKDAPTDLPGWAGTDPSGDPGRELERLLDRFRDQIRDTARDAGSVDDDQLAKAQAVLVSAGERLRTLLG